MGTRAMRVKPKNHIADAQVSMLKKDRHAQVFKLNQYCTDPEALRLREIFEDMKNHIHTDPIPVPEFNEDN